MLAFFCLLAYHLEVIMRTKSVKQLAGRFCSVRHWRCIFFRGKQYDSLRVYIHVMSKTALRTLIWYFPEILSLYSSQGAIVGCLPHPLDTSLFFMIRKRKAKTQQVRLGIFGKNRKMFFKISNRLENF